MWQQCTVEVYDPDALTWESIRGDIVHIEQEQFGYAGRIVLQSEPHHSEWGPQVFFRIRL